MSPRDLFLRIAKTYQDARIPHQVDEKIRRGRSHSISSITEDLFAYYLICNDPSIELVLVDQPIYFKGSKKQVYPDITIVRNGIITAFLDLKMDIGWNRDGLVALCEKHREVVRIARGAECQIRDGVDKTLRTLKISDQVSYNVVLVSRTNINQALLDRQLEEARRLSPEVEIFVLCSKGHPNSYDLKPEQVVESLVIDGDAFRRLHEKIR